jgi:hypothetical protein
MTTYKGINGFAVQSVATDPSPLDEGQVWYNNATYAFKLAAATTVGTWASGGNLNTGRLGAGGAGTQTAALGFGGYTAGPPVSGPTGVTESYNGTAWTNSPATLNTSRGVAVSGGTQTSAIAAAGGPPSGKGQHTETFNGTTWTTGPNLGSAIYYRTGAGTINSAFAAGGSPNGTFNVSTTETWNGSSWTAGGSLVNPTAFAASVGTAADGLSIAGGQASPAIFNNYTQKYNGSAWTSLATVNTARRSLGASSTGPTSSAVVFGGTSSPPTYLTATELWNGTSWTTNPNSLATARGSAGGVGTQAAALMFGGYEPVKSNTEEFTGPGSPVTKTITTS